MKKTLSLALVASAVFAFGLMGCNEKSASSSTASTTAATESAAAETVATSEAAPGEDAGFEEFDIGDEQKAGFLNVAGVYFQPCDLEGNGAIYNAADYAFHIEADISALENDLGYGVGDFVPYLTVDYEIKSNKDQSIAASGTFMLMNASDGPHYGANVKDFPQGSYTVTFKIHSPEENGFLLHTDKLTGVDGRFANYWKEKTLDVSWPNWEWKGKQW